MAKKNLGKVKRYRRSFYTGRQRAARIIGGAVALVALFVAGWLVGPAVINFGTSTWYSIMRDDSEKTPASTSQSVSQPESTGTESQSQAASEPQPTAQPQAEDDMTQGSWAFVDPASLTGADAAAQLASQLAGEGVRYAVVTLKDSTGSVYYASALEAAASSLSTTQIDGAAVASALKAEGIVPVAGVCAFQDPPGGQRQPGDGGKVSGHRLPVAGRCPGCGRQGLAESLFQRRGGIHRRHHR